MYKKVYKSTITAFNYNHTVKILQKSNNISYKLPFLGLIDNILLFV